MTTLDKYDKKLARTLENMVAAKATERALELGGRLTDAGLAHIIESETTFAAAVAREVADFIFSEVNKNDEAKSDTANKSEMD